MAITYVTCGYYQRTLYSLDRSIFCAVGVSYWSVDKALLFSLAIIQIIALWLVYGAVLQLGQGKVGIASLSVLAVGSAPLSVGLVHLYLIETLQVLAVAWFVLILSFAPTWDRAFLLGQLLAASAFALLTRATTPVYCFLIGLVILGYVFWSGRLWNWKQRKTLVVWAVGSALTLGTFFWYNQNLNYVIEHSKVSSSGPIAALWGADDTFLNTLLYWLSQIQYNFFLPVVLAISVVIVVCGTGIAAIKYKLVLTNKELRQFSICALVALLQIIVVLILFSLNSNRLPRFLLPLLPCFALLISWGVAQFNKSIVIGLSLAIYTGQLIVVHGQALALLNPNPFITGNLWPVTTNRVNADILEEIITRTCTVSSLPYPYRNILAIAPGQKGDWLAPDPAYYTTVKRFGLATPCVWGYSGNSFFGATLEKTWEDLQIQRVQFLVTTNPEIYPPHPNSINQSLTPENHLALLEKIKSSGLFVQEPPLQADPGIMIFRRIDYISLGRQLSEVGLQQQAIDTLKKAADLEPTNTEVWANLALVYSRNNQIEESEAAARQALALNPNHYWVNYHLARALYNYGQWAEVITLAQNALVNAPESEKAGILTLLGQAYTQTGDTAEACRYFLQANAAQANQEIITEMKNLDCPNISQ